MTDLRSAHYIKQEPPDLGYELSAPGSVIYENKTDEKDIHGKTLKKMKNPRLQNLLFGCKTANPDQILEQENQSTGDQSVKVTERMDMYIKTESVDTDKSGGPGLSYLPSQFVNYSLVTGNTEFSHMTSNSAVKFSESKNNTTVSALQKSHRRLSDLLSGVSSGNNNIDPFKVASFSTCSLSSSSPGSSHSGSPSVENQKQSPVSTDKNGELLQMLLTKGPSSYVRTLNSESALNSRTSSQNVSNHIHSKASSTCLKNILGGKSTSTSIAKISSPSLRKMLSSPTTPSAIDLSSSSQTTSTEIIPEPTRQTILNIRNASTTNDKQSNSAISNAKESRLDKTIRKLKAKQDICDKDGSCVVSALEHCGAGVVNKSDLSQEGKSQGSPTDHTPLQNSSSKLNNSTGKLHHKISMLDSLLKADNNEVGDRESPGNVDSYTRWIDKVTASLVSNGVTSNDAGTTGSVDEATDYTNLVNLDKYKTLQKHLLASPLSPVNSQNGQEKSLKRKTEPDDSGSSTTEKECIKKVHVDEDYRLLSVIDGSIDGDSLKRPFVEKPPFYKCSECNKAFEHKGTLKVHERMHSMEKEEFKCDICGKVCSAKGYLGIHMRTHRLEFASSLMPDESILPMQNNNKQTSNPMQICTICGKSFNEIENLFIHLRMHSGEKLYKCEICGNGFTRKTQLAIHMRIHTGEKPYECDVCGKTFRQSNGLNLHMTTHTENKPYKCEICGGGFGRKAHYEKHMRRHRGERPFLCGICNKGFTDKFNLSMHMKIHSKTKDHVCDICGNGYNQATHLKNHMQFHNGEKGYACGECSTVFEHKRSLKNHIKSDHPDQYQAVIQNRKDLRNQRRRIAKRQKEDITEIKEDSGSDGEGNGSDDYLSSEDESETENKDKQTQVKTENKDKQIQVKTEILDSFQADVKMERNDDVECSQGSEYSQFSDIENSVTIKLEPW